VLVYQIHCLWRRDAGYCLPAGRQAGMLDAGQTKKDIPFVPKLQLGNTLSVHTQLQNG